MVYFDIVELDQLEQIRKYRNKNLQSLRTPYKLTRKMQEDFYNKTICNRQSNSRYCSINNTNYMKGYQFNEFIGMAGIENIQWENRIGEISIIILDKFQKKGLGRESLHKLLDFGFFDLNLENIWGECYFCNEALEFWKKIIKEYNIESQILKNKKYYQGTYYDSLHFSFQKNDYYFHVTKEQEETYSHNSKELHYDNANIKI